MTQVTQNTFNKLKNDNWIPVIKDGYVNYYDNEFDLVAKAVLNYDKFRFDYFMLTSNLSNFVKKPNQNDFKNLR